MEGIRKSGWRHVYLLGLDAPLIAVLWLFLFAKTWRVNYHPWEVYVTLGLIAWTMRVLAKLLYSAMQGDRTDLHKVRRKWLARSAVVAGLIASVLTILNFPLSIYYYLLIGGILVIAYFALALFSSEPDGETSYPKHLLAGVAFAFGTAIMAHVYLPNLTLKDLLSSREFICFALLCTIASTASEYWSRAMESGDQEASYQEEWLISLPLTLLGAFALVFAVQADSLSARPFFYGILTGAALLQVLNRTFRRFAVIDTKVLASVCLLLPGLIFQAYEMSR